MKKANPAAVGAFVLGALALTIVGVVTFGTGTWLRDTERFVLFFDGSVNGLAAGSPVKIRGVEIGSVLDVSALADTERMEIVNEVSIQIDPQRFKRIGPALPASERTRTLVEHGLRARLELQSFVTGQLYVGLDFYPDTPVHLTGIRAEYPELPTLPSVSQEVASTVRALVARLQELPLEQIVKNLDETLSAVKTLVSSPDLAQAVAELDDTVGEVRLAVADARGAVTEARELVDNLDARVAPVADSALAALEEARRALANVDGAVQPGSDVRYQLTLALEEVADAARAIRLLADYVERNPRSLVFGRRPEEAR